LQLQTADATEDVMKNPSSYMARVVIRQAFASACLLVALAMPALGQSPAFDIVGGATDPSTGNVHVSIPLFSRPWMSATLELNTHIFVGGAYTQWQWNGGWTPSIYGNQGIFPQAVSGIEYSVNPEVIIPENGACTTTQEYFVTDPGGSQHPLPTTFWACLGGSGNQYELPLTSTTTDNSGITVTTNGISVTAVYDKSGNKYTSTETLVYTGYGVGGYSPVWSYTKTDPNGNISTRAYNASNATWTWTDQAGNAFLTEKHNQGSSNTPKDVYTYTDGNGTTQTITVNYTAYAAGNTSIGCSGIAEEPTLSTVYFPTSVVVSPANATYTLNWTVGSINHRDGHLGSVFYPNGSYVAYSYTAGNNNSEETCAGTVGTLSVTSSPDGTARNTITYVNNRTSGQSDFTVTATNSTDNSKVVTSYSSVTDVNFASEAGWPYPGQFVTEMQTYQGSTLLATSIRCYNGYSISAPLSCVAPTGTNIPASPINQITAFSNHDSMPATTTNKVNDTFDSFGNHLVHEVFDWGTWGGSALTATTKAYVDTVACGVNTSTSYIADRVCNEAVSDGAGTNYRYSSYTYSSAGNLTQSKAQLTTTPTYLTTTYSGFTSQGFPTSVAISGGGTTTLTYGGCGGFGLTKVAAPVSAAGNTQQTWDCNGGVITSVTDPNNNVVHFYHLDPFYRLTKITYPDSASDVDTFSYTAPSTYPPSMTNTSALTASTSVITNTTLDGFGHVTAIVRTDPNNTAGGPNCATGYACQVLGYNGLYQLITVSNAFFTTSDPTFGYLQYQYDALGRKTLVTNPDNTSYHIYYQGRGVHPYGLQSLNTVTQYDGAGRPTIVCDGANDSNPMANGDTPKNCGLADQTATGFPTVYSYTPAGDLYYVTFGGTSTSEYKAYSHDMAGRIIAQRLPEETANETFLYDSQIPGGLRTYTDARGITITYTLDDLYRPTSISFSDGTPTITNAYDLASQTNGKGRLSTSSTANTINGFNYDAMGRMNLKGEQAPMLFGVGNTVISYTFDFAGDITALSDSATNNTLTWTRNGIGQVTGETASYTGITGDIVPTTILSAFTYNALGLPTAATGATGWPRTYGYDAMGRLINQGDTDLAPYTLSVGRDADGKVISTVDSVSGNWTYTYDNYFSGGRLLSASCAGTGCTTLGGNTYGTASWTYDEYGNRWTQTASYGLNTTFVYDTQQGGAMHNRLTSANGAVYDAAGDMTTDTAGDTFTFDALHRVLTASQVSSTFVYDGLGHRVEDSDSGGVKDFYYDGSTILHWQAPNGKAFGMKAGFGEYEGPPGSMKYYEDWRNQVGDLRQQMVIVTDSNGEIASENSQQFMSLPFGDTYTDINQAGGKDTDLISKMLFGDLMQLGLGSAGASNLSATRLQNVQQGRWLTPDPAHQGWNAYVYANNNPVTESDPSGLCSPDDPTDCPGESGYSPGGNPPPNVNDPCGNGGTGGCTGGGEPSQPNGETPQVPCLDPGGCGLVYNYNPPTQLPPSAPSPVDDYNAIVSGTNATLFWSGAGVESSGWGSNLAQNTAQPQQPTPQPPPIGPNGNPLPPPVPVPGAPDIGWQWNPNRQNPRGGTWGPDGWKGPNPPSGSWDPAGHWDINSGKGEPVDHYGPNGEPLTPGQVHPGNPPTKLTSMWDIMKSLTPGPVVKLGTAGILIYLIIDEGSRLYLPRNFVPVP
jgi:YD repeat-containing protein